MRKIIVILAIAVFACGLLTGCQPTPQEDVVVEKDIDEMIEKAIEEKEETAEPLAFPEKYECAFTEFDGRFNVSADVKITAPKNVSSLPTVKTRGRAFAQDEVTRLFRYLFADETAYDVLNQSTVMTKTGIEASIVALERAIAFGYDGEALTEEQVSEHLRQIEALKAEYPSAPDKAEELPVSDGTLSDGSNMGSVGKRLMVRDAAQERSLDIWSSAESDSYIHYTTDRVYAVYDSESSADAADSPEGLIPLSEAESAAQALLDAMGAENLQKTGVYLADDRQIGLVDGIVKDAENYAYKFVYSSLIEGVPVANMGNTLVSSEYGESRRYEKIELLIDNEGIAEFVWNAPMEIREVVSTHTNIVDFETAVERFEELMFQSYSPWVASEDAAETGMKMNFNVSDVELSLMRIIDPKAAEATGDIYVPAYLFYGVGTLEQDGQFIGYIENPSVCNLEFTGEKAFVVINAIDGSSINVEEGY